MTTINAPTDSSSQVRADTDLVVVAIVSCAIAILHVSAAVGHFADSRLYGAAFIVLAVVQFGWGCLLATSGRTQLLLKLGIALNAGVIAVWVLSRTVGLPVGPDLGHPEAIGIPDATATFDELALILFSLRVAFRRTLPERAHLAAGVLAFATLLVFLAFSHVG